MKQQNWHRRFEREMAMAEQARNQGNEGKARVCARRAAGIVADEYMKRQGVSTPNATAYDRVRMLADWPDIPAGVSKVVEHMTLRVDMDFQLPADLDLVEDARWLADVLLPPADCESALEHSEPTQAHSEPAQAHSTPELDP